MMLKQLPVLLILWSLAVFADDSDVTNNEFMHMISRDSEGRGLGVNCRLEHFQKFIRFGTLTPPLDWYDY